MQTLAIIFTTVILVGLIIWAIKRNSDDDGGSGGSRPSGPKRPR